MKTNMAGAKQFFLAAACAFLLAVAMANPPLAQYGDQVDPAQNWEAVILSRNGPSTTTTPRPRTKAPQELRSFGIAPLHGHGTGSIEKAKLAPSRQKQKYTVDTPASGASAVASVITALAASMALLTVLW